MPGPKRVRRERIHEWEQIQQSTLWPEQLLYEQLRPMLLFGETAGERAKEIDVPQRTLARKADEFERNGVQSLFSSGEQGGARATQTSLPLRCANSSLTCTLSIPECPGARLLKFVTFATGDAPPTTV